LINTFTSSVGVTLIVYSPEVIVIPFGISVDFPSRLSLIINELNCGIKELDNMFYETFRISQNGYYSISEWELKEFTDKLQELKGSDKE
jgi:hypothetical protein